MTEQQEAVWHLDLSNKVSPEYRITNGEESFDPNIWGEVTRVLNQLEQSLVHERQELGEAHEALVTLNLSNERLAQGRKLAEQARDHERQLREVAEAERDVAVGQAKYAAQRVLEIQHEEIAVPSQ